VGRASYEQYVQPHQNGEIHNEQPSEASIDKRTSCSDELPTIIMKRYGDLFPQIVDMTNLKRARCAAQKGKRSTRLMESVNAAPKEYLNRLQQQLQDHSFTTSPYQTFVLRERKERRIYKLPYYPDRIVHHAIMQVMRPLWDKVFIHDVYSSIPGRGIHAGIRRVQQFLQDRKRSKYCLQFDIHKFYPSVVQEILAERVRHKVKCADTLKLLDDIIYSPGGTRGLPIGNYTSQYLANIYLNPIDHWIKEDLRCKYYVRYADDGILLSGSKQRLHAIWRALAKKLRYELGVELNPKTQVYNVATRGIDFLGYRIFRRYILMRKRSVTAFRRIIRWIKENWPHVSATYIIGTIMSRLGWLQHANCYNLTQSLIYSDSKLMTIFDASCSRLEQRNPLYKEAL